MKRLFTAGTIAVLFFVLPSSCNFGDRDGITASFGSVDIRYPIDTPPDTATLSDSWTVKAWRGERVHTRIVIHSERTPGSVTVKPRLRTMGVEIGALGYVIADSISRFGTGNDMPPVGERYEQLVADVITREREISIEQGTTRTFWFSVDVPRDAAVGVHKGVVKVNGIKLPFSIEVSPRVLPKPKDWSFHLDLWQNPFSVARFHDVPLWSDEHFELMRPLMEKLAAAGQKNITASIIHDPWNGQTYDIYHSMIAWTKLKDGTWSYDYTVFDHWVEFMRSCGIDGLVSCYSMIPWNNTFYYRDEALGADTCIVARAGTREYNDHWRGMLTDFARHLRDKGWFDRTAIAMDERPEADMLAAMKLVREVDEDFKLSLAGNFHASVEPEIFDYSIALMEDWPAEVVRARKGKDMPTTFYTCCAEGHPNTFTASPLVESAWMGLHAAAMGYDGYLRWAWNCWPESPMTDSRFGHWASGDTYLVYPCGLSSVRFERLVEGIRQWEKVRILRESLAGERLLALERALEPLKAKDPQIIAAECAERVNAAIEIINSL